MPDALARELAALRSPALAADAARALAHAAERAAAAGDADIAYAPLDSPVGVLLAAATPSGLVTLAFTDGTYDDVLARLAARLSPRIVEAPGRLDPWRRELEEYFAGRRRHFDAPVDWSLIRAPFTRRVLEATARIPYGGVGSYASVAAEAGSPAAVRAAGNALGSNPIPIVVPCHRVLRSGGALGGYGGGVERKKVLLALEGGQAGLGI